MDILSGLFLGISNNYFCLGSCAPALLPYMLAEGQKPFMPILQFMAGRLLAYIFFGFTGGIIGIYFEGRLNPRIFSILMITFSLWLLIYSIANLGISFKTCQWIKKYISGNTLPFYLGIIMGLNLCPPFLLGLNKILSMGSILKPIFFFIAFYAGSSLWLILFLFTGKLAQNNDIKNIGKLTSILVGLWYLVQGLLLF